MQRSKHYTDTLNQVMMYIYTTEAKIMFLFNREEQHLCSCFGWRMRFIYGYTIVKLNSQSKQPCSWIYFFWFPFVFLRYLEEAGTPVLDIEIQIHIKTIFLSHVSLLFVVIFKGLKVRMGSIWNTDQFKLKLSVTHCSGFWEYSSIWKRGKSI